MKVLLDECVPEPLHALLQRILRGHHVDHVKPLGWAGKKDVPLLRDAGRGKYEIFVTNNLAQFQNPDECDAIKKSGLHHVTYELDSGLDGLGRACGALCAAMRGIVTDLQSAPGQRLVRVTGLKRGVRRYTITDPAVDPPSGYWP